MGARGEGQEQPPVSRPSRICEIGSFRLGCCPTPPPAHWSGGCFGHPHPLIVHLLVLFMRTALSWEPVAPPALRDRLGGLFQQIRQPLGRVPLVPDVPPSRPVVPDAPPVIRAIRPVTVLVGIDWGGSSSRFVSHLAESRWCRTCHRAGLSCRTRRR